MQESGAVMQNDQDALLASEPPCSQMLYVLSSRLPSLYWHAYKVLGNKADAEDAVQDALLAAHKHLNQFRGDARISTWLMTIVINCARMQLRKRSRHEHLSLDSRIGKDHKLSLSESLVDTRPNPEDECHESKLSALLMKSIARLSLTLRRTFHLRYVDHLSVSETARVLGVSIATVKTRTARARAKLMKSIGGLLESQSRGCRRRR
jgi:RNA polymerase sigma-70 factor (ECF subfamily)